MKCVALVWVMMLCLLPLRGWAEERSSDPLTGLWVYERTDNSDMDFTSYVEYMPDGTWIFQMVSGSEVTYLHVAAYASANGRIVYDDSAAITYSVAGDTLTCTEEAVVPWQEPAVYTYRRVTERPPELLKIRRSGDFCYTEDGLGNAMIVGYLDWNDPGDPEETLVVPDSLDGRPVTGLRRSAFEACVKDTVILPAGITAIPDLAFDNANVRRIILPRGVTEIEDYAFGGVAALEEIDLPEGLVRIGRDAFSNTALTEIDLPESLAVLDGNPFSSCMSLTRIGLPEDHSAFCLIDGVLFSREDRRLIWYPVPRTAEHYDIPEGTRVIDEAFYEQQYLTSVTLPDSVTEIRGFAFYGCRRLQRLELPASVTAIGPFAFAQCWGLKTITFPDGITELPESVLHGAVGLRTVQLPDTLARIGEYAFCDCSSLTGVVIPDGVTEIGTMAFCDCYSMTSVVLPESLESIGFGAFDGCSRLTRLVIPAGVTQIGNQAFEDCGGLILVVVPGTYAEQYCQEQGIPYEYAG